MSFLFGRNIIPLLVAIVLVACNNANGPENTSADEPGQPVYGGTIRIVGASDVDHLATTSAYVTTSVWLVRAFARQLVAYTPSADYAVASARSSYCATRSVRWVHPVTILPRSGEWRSTARPL